MTTSIMRRIVIGLTALMLAGGLMVAVAPDHAAAYRHYCVGCDDRT